MSSLAFTVQVRGEKKSFRIKRDQSFISAHAEVRDGNGYFLVFDGESGTKEVGPLDNRRDGEKVLRRFSKNWSWLPWTAGATAVAIVVIGVSVIAWPLSQTSENRAMHQVSAPNVKAMMDEAVRRAMIEEQPSHGTSITSKRPDMAAADDHPNISKPAEGWKR